jgi:glycosyltransferase involved in cell wall biosynthesis
LEPKKNVTVLFQAFAWLKKNRGLPHKLVLIGPQEVLDRAVGKTMAQLGLNEAVTRMHYVSPDDLRIAYSQADVFVFPSLAEGFGFPPLEAMACGAPVVASNIAVLRETLGDAAILLPPDDPSLLAIAIHKVLTNAFLRRTLVERGLQRVRKFDWVEAARKILDVYQAVDEDQGREQTSSPRPQGGPK